jgi:uncharacterized protein YrrD
MILTYTKIVDQNIYELKSQHKLGKVSEIIIKKSNLSIYGVILQNDSFLGRNVKVVNAADIVELTPNGVLVKDEDSVTSLKDNLRMKEAIDHKYFGIGQKVYTRKGKYIGKVFDFTISSDTLEITKFYTKSLLAERIIASAAIVEFNKKKIVIKNDYESVAVAAVAVETCCV